MDKNGNECEFVSKAKFPTIYGDFEIYAFEDKKMKTHLAIVRGEPKNKESVAVRIHSRCLTGDALGSRRCDCREQYEKAMRYLAQQSHAVMIYLNQEGRGIGLANKIRAYTLQDEGLDTVQANHQLGFAEDLRDYSSAVEMLKFLGVKSIMLMTNNPNKIKQIEENGMKVVGRIPLIIKPNEHDKKYIDTKKNKMGHIIDEQDG